MNIELFIAYSAFAIVSSITPGPNNLMIMASGANFGVRRSLPHWWGIGLGFMFMIVVIGLGLVQVFDAYPISYEILTVASVIYMLYLAWKIANAAPPEEQGTQGTPMTFMQAVLIQWVNPKAWAMAITAMSVYLPQQDIAYVVLFTGIFGLYNLPCVMAWAVLGQQLSKVLNNNTKLRLFNWSMAALLLLSMLPVVLERI